MNLRKRSVLARCVLAPAAVVLSLAVASTLEAADVDLASDIAGDAPVAPPGEPVTFAVTYDNNGPGVPASSAVNLDIPPGVPAILQDVTPDQADAIEASLFDTLGNDVGLFVNSNCDGLLIQTQNDGQPVGITGVFTADIPMPMDGARERKFIVDDPPSIAADYEIAGLGSCFDANNNIDCETLSTCFGPPLSSVDAFTAPLRVVDDGSADPTFGCNPLLNDMTDAIAMIRRGGCEFGLKSLNAEQAGALGVAISNDRPGALSMGVGFFGQLVTIPVLLLFQTDGEDILAVLEGGGSASATMGGVLSEDITMRSQAFHAAGSPDVDPVPGNDADAFTVTLGEVIQEPAIPVTTPVGRLLLIVAMAAAGIVAIRALRL